MLYAELPFAQGRARMAKVWNFFFKPLSAPDFFVEPWANCELADCAEFRGDEILFFVADRALIDFLNRESGELYLFGAYNQMSVCQMRARGTVMLTPDHPEAEQVKARLRTAIERRVGATVNGLTEEEAQQRYAILDQGQLFWFIATAYAFGTYERG